MTSSRDPAASEDQQGDRSFRRGRFRRLLFRRPRHSGPAIASRRGSLFASISTSQAPTSSDKPKSPDQKPLLDVVAGALARACSQASIHPIDTLKVRMQAKGLKKQELVSSRPSAIRGRVVGASVTVSSGIQQQLSSVTSLYKGVGGAASAAGIIIGTYFAFYSTAKQALSTQTSLSPGSVAFISGSLAAVGSSTVKVPLAVCVRSVQAGVYNNVFDAASQIRSTAGVRGLFTGWVPTLLEDVPDMAVKFAVYESLRPLHQSLTGGRPASTFEDLLMGGAAGVASAAVTTPLDVVKTRMMCSASRRPTIMSALRETLDSKEGARALLRGLGPRCISNGLNSALFFCFFEAIRQNISRPKEIHVLQTAEA